MARVIAKGPVLSQGALLGEQVGAGFGAGFLPGFETRSEEIKLINQYDPVRQVLAERLGAGPQVTAGQQMLAGLTQDPLAFARAMENPNTIASLTGTANLASAPTVEEDPVEKAIRFVTQADEAEAQGDTIRPPLLRARAAQILDIDTSQSAAPDLDVFVAVSADGSMKTPVQRNPETGKWKDLNGQDVELAEGTQIYNVADLATGETQREIRTDINGVARFVDTQEPVFPGVEKEEEPDPGDPQAAIFAQRAQVASDAINTLGEEFTGFWDRLGGRVPQGLRSDERQVYDQAATDFITAILRPESGAQINQSEFDDARDIYIPKPGDSQAVIQRKAASRAAAVAGLEVMAGNALEEVRNSDIMPSVEVNGQKYLVGSVITNAEGARGIINPDGSVTILGQ